MSIHLRDPSWWFWAVSALLLIAGLAGWTSGFALAAALSLFQIVWFVWREQSFGVFAVQVRLAYAAILFIALRTPMDWLFWAPAVGTPAQALFGYCFLARALSLAPWNLREPLTWRLVWRTFTSPPSGRAILQARPATS